MARERDRELARLVEANLGYQLGSEQRTGSRPPPRENVPTHPSHFHEDDVPNITIKEEPQPAWRTRIVDGRSAQVLDLGARGVVLGKDGGRVKSQSYVTKRH